MKPKLISPEEAVHLDHKQVKSLYKQYINPSFATMLGLLNFNKRFVHAEGVYVWDDQGKRYLDFLEATVP